MAKKPAVTLNSYDSVHANRFAKSIEYLKKFVPKDASILETGGATGFTSMLQELGEVTNSDKDIRFDLPEGKYDVIVATEIIEHLKDVEPDELNFDKISTWEYSGVISFLSLCKSRLKKDGIIFISTPNASTYKCIANMLYGQSTFMYRQHVREMAIGEIEDCVFNSGLKVYDKKLIDVWGSHGVNEWFKKEIDVLAKKAGSSFTHREDNIFLILKAK